MTHWKNHFKYYDLFQNNYSKYLCMLEFHAKNLKKQKFILDSGAGTGNLTKLLINGNHKIIACDNNEFALKVLKQKCRSKNLSIKKINLSKKLPFPSNYFDGIASSIVIPYIFDTKKYIFEHARVLKPSGIMTISVALPEQKLFEKIMGKLKKELIQKKLLPKYQKEYNQYCNTTKKNVADILKKNTTKKKILTWLKQAGLKPILHKSSYGNAIAFIRCQKVNA